MDKNQFIGLALMLVLITTYFTWFAPEPPVITEEAQEQAEKKAEQNNQERIPAETPKVSEIVTDSAALARYGIFSTAVLGDRTTFDVENEDAVFTFDSKGAIVKKVLLKKHKTFDGKPLILFDEKSTNISYDLSVFGEEVTSSDLIFKVVEGQHEVSGEDTTEVSFSASLSDGSEINFKYAIPGKGYVIDQYLNFEGFNNGPRTDILPFSIISDVKKVEKDIDISRQNTTVKYYTEEGEIEGISETSKDDEKESYESKVNWASIKQKFFSLSYIARNEAFEGVTITSSIPETDTIVKAASLTLGIPFKNINNRTEKFSLFFGPLKYDDIKGIAPGFDKNIYLGWKIFRTINTYVMIPIFNLLNKITASHGLIIFLMVIFIRLILSPLTFKSHMSMAKMKVLKPEIDEIKEKHGDDQQKVQADQMKLYKEFGINPVGGCIPMLLQMPILFAMFNFFPYMSEFRQKAFLWAEDLSSYDSIIDLPFAIPFYGDHVSLFTILMTVSTILTIWSNSSMNSSVQGPMKTMQYIMPIMFLFVLNKYAAALTFYYFVSNVFSFSQQSLMKKFIDEDNIKAKLEENKKKNAGRKKSKFSQRLDEAMKASAQAQKAKKKKKK